MIQPFLRVSIAPIGSPLLGPHELGMWSLRLVAWGLTLMSLWSFYRAIVNMWSTARRMHQIPCSGCQYFTHDYFLKCTVHPGRALSEEAIGCRDYHNH